MKRSIGLAAAVAGFAVAGLVTERTVVRRVRGREDAERDQLFVVPGDVSHHEMPSYDGGRLHVIQRGRGRPLVLLHGVTLTAEIWAPQLHQLADRYRLIACDLRGHGNSEVGRDGFGLDHIGHDVATVLEHLDLRDAIVVGHSMGGMALMRFCGDHTDVLDERVAGLGFVATSATLPTPAIVVGRTQRLADHLVRRAEAGRPVRSYRFGESDLSWLLCRLAFGRRAPAAAVEQVRAMIAAVPPEVLHPCSAGILLHDGTDALRATHTPSFVVVGALDLLTPPFASRRIAELLPGTELHVLAGAGHQLMQERPDELAALIDALVARLEKAEAPVVPVP
ncbi:alpha/beta hydrolase [soil metagenome]